MADRSLIEWTDSTWNPITGCSPVSPACDHCYASRMVKRFPHLHGTKPFPLGGYEEDLVEAIPFSRVQFHPSRLDQPLRWKKPRRIFVCSMGDFWHPDVTPMMRVLVFNTIRKCSQHTFILLTKRAKEMFEDVTDNSMVYRFFPLPNVIGMVTAENQEMADERIPYLLKTPFSRRGVSIEPMLGPVNLNKHWSLKPEWKGGEYPTLSKTLHWVIAGGESGPGARFTHPHWVENLRDQCTEAGVPFFFKGWGTKMMKKTDPNYMNIDGREWKEFPK